MLSVLFCRLPGTNCARSLASLLRSCCSREWMKYWAPGGDDTVGESHPSGTSRPCLWEPELESQVPPTQADALVPLSPQPAGTVTWLALVLQHSGPWEDKGMHILRVL